MTLVRGSSRGADFYYANDSEWAEQGKLWMGTGISLYNPQAPGRDQMRDAIFLPIAFREMLSGDGILTVGERVAAHIERHHPSLQIFWVEMTDDLDPMGYVMGLWKPEGNGESLFFYSPKDYEFSHSWAKFADLMRAGDAYRRRAHFIKGTRFPIDSQVEEDGSTSITYSTVKPRDLYGWCGGNLKGLKDLAEVCGIDTSGKSGMDAYKSRMDEGLIQEPEKFIDYLLWDVQTLFRIRERFPALLNEVVRGPIGLGPLWEGYDIPTTLGRLVSDTFIDMLEATALQLVPRLTGDISHLDPEEQAQVAKKAYRHARAIFDLACKKVGIPQNGSKLGESHTYLMGLKTIEEVVKALEEAEALMDSRREEGSKSQLDVPHINRVLRGDYRVTAISAANVRVIGGVTEDSTAFSAIVAGGRCQNERPDQYRHENVLDIDLSSAYGSKLGEYSFPVGLPFQIGYYSGQTNPTLREFLKTYKNEFPIPTGEPGERIPIWNITGSTTKALRFRQDLILSRLVSQTLINRACLGDMAKAESQDEDRDDDPSHIPGDIALLRREIENGVFTPQNLKVLQKVATDKEWNELQDNIVVIAAISYPESLRCANLTEWVEKVLAESGPLQNVKGNRAKRTDARSYAWFEVPIGNYVHPILAHRQKLKKEMKALIALIDQGQATQAEIDHCKALKSKQEFAKLFVNTLYGDICSPFHKVGNAVVGNMITAACRAGVWMASKALHLKQTITDGGLYCPGEVAIICGKRKPGLDSLASQKDWLDKTHQRRKLVSLGGLDWAQEIAKLAETQDFKGFGELVDRLAKEHIASFWAPYGLSLPFEIEHKPEHTSTVAVTWGAADNAFWTVRKEPETTPDMGWAEGRQVVIKIRGTRKHPEGSQLRDNPKIAHFKLILRGDNTFQWEGESLDYDKSHLVTVTEVIRKMVSIPSHVPSRSELPLRPGEEEITKGTLAYNNGHFHCDTIGEWERRNGRKTVRLVKKVKTRVPQFEKFGPSHGTSGIHSRMMRDEL